MRSNLNPLIIHLHPSYYLMSLLLLIHLAVLLLILLLPLPLWAMLLISLCIAGSMIQYLWELVFYRRKKSVIALKADSLKEWHLETREGKKYTATLIMKDITVTRFIIILYFKRSDQKKCRVILMRDSTLPHLFRRLIVLLKFGSAA
jgi:hypothetical protein